MRLKNTTLKQMLIPLVLAFVVSCEDYKYEDLGEGIFAEFHTNKGLVVTKLYFEDKPLTVANFVSLAEGTNPMVIDTLKGVPFYNNTLFHVVKPDFIQGGDRSATGLGHPGYKFADEFIKLKSGKVKYKHGTKGVLSMANSGKDSNGAQFFFTQKETPWLDGKHSVFGFAQKGRNVLNDIRPMDTLQEVKIIRQGNKALEFNAPQIFVKRLAYLDSLEIVREKNYVLKKEAFLEQMNYSEAELTPKGIRVFTKVKGTGEKAKSNQLLQVHYVGYLEDGTIFDSSYKRNKPLAFRLDVDQLISGWTEGIRGLEEGSEVILFIPYYLAYGEEGRLPLIPEKADLIFDMKLVKVGK